MSLCPKCNERHTIIGIGDFYEDCGYQPLLCVRVERYKKSCNDDLEGISLIDGHVRSCSLFSCGVSRLTPLEAAQWRLHGPQRVDKREQQPDAWEKKWWTDYDGYEIGVVEICLWEGI